MRFVVYGAGAIGGVVGARLSLAGHDVTLVARGRHFEAIADHGLTLEWPGERTTLHLPVVEHPRHLAWEVSTVVLITVKSQHTEAVLDALAPVAPPETMVVCLQNGVENERRVLRRFARTYGVCVICPASHLEPGVVQAHSAPVTGLLDIGRFPSGVDDDGRSLAAAFESATFESQPRTDVMRWKYAKLLSNLMNAPEALCGPGARQGQLADLVRSEAVAVLDAAGIGFASVAEDEERRAGRLRLGGTESGAWRGGSSWQSVTRGSDSIEADFLNGEISWLGRLHHVATPVNDELSCLARRLVRDGAGAGSMSLDELLASLEAARTASGS